MSDPFKVVRDFEAALCAYTGAPFAVTTTSCTDAIKLAVAWHLRTQSRTVDRNQNVFGDAVETIIRPPIEIPKHTYVGVPMAIIHAGGRPVFRDEQWRGCYQLKPLPIWDCARFFSRGMYRSTYPDPQFPQDISFRTEINCQGQIISFRTEINCQGQMHCVSFHWAKTLGIQQGGAILHDDPEADRWLRMARFDGRQEGVHPKDQKEWIIGHHAYMAPETAAAGLVRLRNLPRHNPPLPWGPGTDSDYPDLSTFEIFK